jgi:hypothetical protein
MAMTDYGGYDKFYNLQPDYNIMLPSARLQ